MTIVLLFEFIQLRTLRQTFIQSNYIHSPVLDTAEHPKCVYVSSLRKKAYDLMADTVQSFSYKVKDTECHWRNTKGCIKWDGKNRITNFYQTLKTMFYLIYYIKLKSNKEKIEIYDCFQFRPLGDSYMLSFDSFLGGFPRSQPLC